MEIIKQLLQFSEQKPLLFTQMYFWVFFTIAYIIFSFIYKQKVLRNSYLFLISLFFYYKSSGLYFFLLIFSTVSDYTLGILIAGSIPGFRKKLFLFLSIFINLALLAYFKYSYLFIDSLNYLLGTEIQVYNIFTGFSNMITSGNLKISEIILPVGISFYTFQTISYTVDVYKGKLKPVRNILDFGFYVSFFPHLVAGPIVRASEFIPQLYTKYKLTKEQFGHALYLILTGLIKKVIISDYISINFVDRVFENPLSFTGFENLMAVYGYALQIYCDFSGYTDIAIGVALLFGFRLPINFNSPYKAKNITDFWRRWHISLSRWLKDYLYIPLGGNKKGKVRTYINLMLTMLLGGLWHGANWRFVIWGGIHGVALAFHKFITGKRSTIDYRSKWRRGFSVFLTFQLICITWIFFRAEDMQHVGFMLEQIFLNFGFNVVGEMIIAYWYVMVLIVGGLIIHWIPAYIKEDIRGRFIQTNFVLQIIITLITAFILYQAKSSELQPFIYFQF